MRIKRFEDIEAWQSARKLTRMVYDVTKEHAFLKDLNLQNQLRRAYVSIMANIAEGFGRESNKEFIQFLSYASSSNTETQSHLYILLDQNYISEEKFNELYQQSILVGNLINGFVRYLKQKHSINRRTA